MLPVTLAGEDFYLLPWNPDWSQPFSASFAIPVIIDPSQGGIEARTPTGDTLRETQSFRLVLKGDNAARFAIAQQRLGSKRILCPFWPGAHRLLTAPVPYLDNNGQPYLDPFGQPYTYSGVTTPVISSGLWLTFEPGLSAYEVHTSDEPTGFTPSALAIRVPLLIGYFKSIPSTDAVTDQRLAGTIDFLESGPALYALRPATIAPGNGPSIGSRAIPLLDHLINWSTRPQAGGAGITLEREQTGHGRELTVIAHPQDSVRILSATYLLRDWLKISAILSFFLDRKGQASAFWVPGLLSHCQLVAPATAGSAVVTVNDASLLGDNRYIAFTRPGQPSICRHVESVNLGANTLTLDASPGDLPVGSVNLVSLVLVRFAKPSINLSWSTDARATGRLDFVEVSPEYYLPTGEVHGETFAALPTIAYLYRFSRYYPGQTIVNRYTSHERDLLLDGETFLARAFEHDSIKDTIDLEDVSAEIKAPAFPGNPLLLFSPHRLEVPLYCEIIECQVGPDGAVLNPISRLFGQVSKPRPRGVILTATVGSILGEISQTVPAFNVQRGCNVSLFSAPCAVLESAWTFSGTIDSISGNSITLSSLVRLSGAAMPTIGDRWFSSGRFWTGTGETYESRTIFNSAVGSGTVTLVLSHPLHLTPGAPVYFAPGCGGSYLECVTKYDNRVNFRGIPFLPLENPSLVPIQNNPEPNAGMKK